MPQNVTPKAKAEPEWSRFTYKELATALGVSADAARMKAKRKAKKGDWQIIPGNHPSDKVTVLIPENDQELVGERVGGDEPEHPERKKGRTREPERGGELFTLYTEAQKRIQALTDQLLEAQADRVALAASEAREMALAAEIEALQRQLDRAHADIAFHRRTWWQKLTGR